MTRRHDSFQGEKRFRRPSRGVGAEVNGKVEAESYGTVIVKASASVGYSTSDSAEQATREAVRLREERVERSAQKIIESVKEERTLRDPGVRGEQPPRPQQRRGQHHVVGVYAAGHGVRRLLKNIGKRLVFELRSQARRLPPLRDDAEEGRLHATS